MDEVLDRLYVINYHRDFCRDFGLNPLTRHYFVVPASNPNEQFYYFTCLFSWLLKKCGVHFDQPGQFDDPNATSANIVAVLKNLNIPFEYGPNRLRQAHGEAIIYVLQTLTERATEKIQLQRPVHTTDDFPEEAEVDVDAEVTMDAIEERLQAAVSDDEEMFMDGLPQTSSAAIDAADAPSRAAKPQLDPAAWHLEVDRVTPLLKVHIHNDNKDWRIHVEQMEHHQQTIASSLSETKVHLTKLHSEIHKNLEKISSREKYINTQFEGQTEEYRNLQDQLSNLKQKYNGASTTVTQLTNELARISENLDNVKAKMDDIGSGMTDSKPLANIKQGMARMKSELKQMDLRIGVIEHALLLAKLKSKGSIAVAAERPAGSVLNALPLQMDWGTIN
ncbi:intra-flagellar transport protein 57 [Cladochytrium replicatum]|nr:intra-flagellar transport protein 57 [Cladochytrium replicatum]